MQEPDPGWVRLLFVVAASKRRVSLLGAKRKGGFRAKGASIRHSFEVDTAAFPEHIQGERQRKLARR